MAVGDLGLTREKFERISWGEFQCMYRGHVRGHERLMHQTRLMMWAAIRPHSKKKLTPADILPLPSDSKSKVGCEKMTKKRLNELVRKWRLES